MLFFHSTEVPCTCQTCLWAESKTSVDAATTFGLPRSHSPEVKMKPMDLEQQTHGPLALYLCSWHHSGKIDNVRQCPYVDLFG
ncbi:uncharacterized protein YALI1_E10339g [Yarrowia lipolytica]|uniref:Uncharacterized protein n=1 Tax=Yarrowia lipolytica TaxID=4952 RepID=A0A1D8NHM1_YARLL|nr:hypothetical protein YALI1_E10339g [Yarrowia lipolytica]